MSIKPAQSMLVYLMQNDGAKITWVRYILTANAHFLVVIGHLGPKKSRVLNSRDQAGPEF